MAGEDGGTHGMAKLNAARDGGHTLENLRERGVVFLDDFVWLVGKPNAQIFENDAVHDLSCPWCLPGRRLFCRTSRIE